MPNATIIATPNNSHKKSIINSVSSVFSHFVMLALHCLLLKYTPVAIPATDNSRKTTANTAVKINSFSLYCDS